MEVDRYKMVYQLEIYTNELSILGEEFTKHNRNKGKLIIKNRKYPLKSVIKLKNTKKIKYKIGMILNKEICDKRFMFKDCIKLLKLSINTKKENPEDIYDDVNYFVFEGKENLFDNYKPEENEKDLFDGNLKDLQYKYSEISENIINDSELLTVIENKNFAII